MFIARIAIYVRIVLNSLIQSVKSLILGGTIQMQSAMWQDELYRNKSESLQILYITISCVYYLETLASS